MVYYKIELVTKFLSNNFQSRICLLLRSGLRRYSLRWFVVLLHNVSKPQRTMFKRNQYLSPGLPAGLYALFIRLIAID